MGAPDKWFMNKYIQEAFPSGATASRVRPSQPDTALGAPGRDPSRSTGVGADGVYQPNAVAGQLHESEWAFSAPVTQALGADTLQAMKTAVENGALTSDKLNMIRQAVGLQGQRGFQGGSTISSFLTGQNQQDDLRRQEATRNTAQAVKLGAIAASNAGAGAQYGTGIAQQPISLQHQREDREVGQYQAITPTDPAAAKKAAMAASNAGTGTQYGTGIAKQPAPVTGPSGANRSTLYRTLGMQGLADMARGQSPYFQAIQDIQQRRLAGQGAAAEEAMRQEMAQGGVGGGVARAALGEQARDIGSQMAEARAKTSAEQMRLAQEATGQLATQAQAGMEFDYNKSVDAMKAASEAGDLGALAKTYENLYGIKLDTTTLQGTQNTKMFGDAVVGAQAVLSTNPNTAWNDAGAKLYLDRAWTATHPGQATSGAAYDTWAEKQWGDWRIGGDPLFQVSNMITQEGATSLFGQGEVDNYRSVDSSGNVITGWPAMHRDLGLMSASKGITVDPTTGAVDFNMTNPLVFKFFGGTTPDYAMIPDFKNAATTVGTKVKWGDNTYERTGTGATDWKVSGGGVATIPLADLTANDYGQWKTGQTTGGNALNIAGSKEGLLHFANLGNADAAKDLAKLYDADPDALTKDYATLPTNVKDSLSTKIFKPDSSGFFTQDSAPAIGNKFIVDGKLYSTTNINSTMYANVTEVINGVKYQKILVNLTSPLDNSVISRTMMVKVQ